MMELWLEAQNHAIRIAGERLDREQREWATLQDGIDKLLPLIASYLNGETSGTDVAEEAIILVPQEDLRRQVIDWFSEIMRKKPEEKEHESAEIVSTRAKVNSNSNSIKQSRKILNSLTRLSEEAQQGDSSAAEALYDSAVLATSLLNDLARNHPDLFSSIAGTKGIWPVLAREEPGWEKAARDQIAKLELGKRLAVFKTRFKPVRGSDVNLPARRWARSAVQTIDEARWRMPWFVLLVKDLGGADEWAEFAVRKNWEIAPRPEWVSQAVQLERFSRQSFDAWKGVVRQLIRESVPNFHLLPEWATQRMTSEANGRATAGEIQNAILDDIVSALKRLAPDSPC